MRWCSPATMAAWSSPISTSTASRTSTTPWATRPAMRSSWLWPSGCTKRSAPDDFLARFGGDEFAVLRRAAGPEDAADACRAAARCIRGQLRRLRPERAHDRLDRHRAWRPSTACRPQELMRHADIALYQGKNQGRDRAMVFCAEMAAEVEQRREIELELHDALEAARADAALPAADLVREQSRHRRRSAAALEAPDQGRHLARRVRADRGRGGPDAGARRLRAARAPSRKPNAGRISKSRSIFRRCSSATSIWSSCWSA